VAVLACVPVGIYAAVHRRRARGLAVSAASQILMSVPAFLAGILLILLFSVTLGWLPAGGYSPLLSGPWQWFRHLILPVLALAIVQSAVLSRYVAAPSSTCWPTITCAPRGRSAGGCGRR
jgi:peptide/nickel transport system permease protein